jgi:hypothetical protein
MRGGVGIPQHTTLLEGVSSSSSSSSFSSLSSAAHVWLACAAMLKNVIEHPHAAHAQTTAKHVHGHTYIHVMSTQGRRGGGAGREGTG